VRPYNPSTQEAEAGGWGKLKNSLDYIENPVSNARNIKIGLVEGLRW
jgi:hypothetical protein